MLKKLYKDNIAKYITVGMLLVVLLILINKKSSYMDTYRLEVSEPGYVSVTQENSEGLKLIAKGLNLNYIYSGKYIITIAHSPAQSGDYCEVVDNKTGDVLASKEYSTKDNSTSILVNVKDRVDSMTVNSYCHEKITISGYVINSDGKVYTDTHWLRRILFVYALALLWGYHSYKKNGSRFIQLLLFATVCSMPLWTNTIPAGHDVAFNYTRYRGIVEGLRLHEFPVRINGVFYHGAGYLVDLMYPGLIQYPFAFMSAHGASTLFSFKIMLITSVFATVFLSYYPIKGILGDKASLIFMFVYTLNPFRLIELYSRCALGEYLAMVFLPLVFAGIYQLVVGDYKIGFYEASIGITLVFTSHLLSVLYVAGFAVASYVLLLCFSKFEIIKDIKRDIIIILCAVFTVLINMWFWVPMLDYYNPSYCIATFHGNISDSLIYLFGAFMDGFTTPEYSGIKGGITNGSASFSVGIITLICVCIYIYRRFIKREAISNVNVLDFALLLGLIALFFESEYFPWEYLEEKGSIIAAAFGKLQFAWRLQMVVAVMFGIVVAGILNCLLTSKKEVFWSLLFIMVVNAAWLSRGYLFENSLYQIGKYNVPETTLNGDYLESTIDYTSVGTYLQNYKEPICEEGALITNVRRDGLNYSFELMNNTGDEIDIKVPILYSGFYQAYINDEMVKTIKDEETTFIKLVIDGKINLANVTIIYSEPLKYRICELVSLMVFVIVMISSVVYLAKNSNIEDDILNAKEFISQYFN